MCIVKSTLKGVLIVALLTGATILPAVSQDDSFTVVLERMELVITRMNAGMGDMTREEFSAIAAVILNVDTETGLPIDESLETIMESAFGAGFGAEAWSPTIGTRAFVVAQSAPQATTQQLVNLKKMLTDDALLKRLLADDQYARDFRDQTLVPVLETILDGYSGPAPAPTAWPALGPITIGVTPGTGS